MNSVHWASQTVTAGVFLKSHKTTATEEQAGQPRPNKKIPMHAPTAIPSMKSEEVETKIPTPKLRTSLINLQP